LNLNKESVIAKHKEEFGFNTMTPWDFLNEVLANLKLDYEFIEPEVISRT
jgi:hypothetical protein